jgi:hypothetical protein
MRQTALVLVVLEKAASTVNWQPVTDSTC